MGQTECQACHRPTQLFLCTHCETELANMLTALTTGGTTTDTTGRDRQIPGIIQDLEDAATGQTRFANTTRRNTNGPYTLHGDMTIDDAAGLTEGINTNQLRNRLLATGRVNGHASQLITEIRTELTLWTSRLAKHTGILYTPPDPHDTTAYAQWLTHHTHTLASIETIHQLHHRLTQLTKRAQRCVDRPPAPRFCGQCDTMINRKMCCIMLYTRPDAIEVTCPNPNCRTTHNIEKLYTRWENSIDHQIVSREKIIGNQRTPNAELYDTGIMGALNEFVHWQAFNRWIRDRHLKPVRYLRANGRRGFFRHGDDDIPEYRVGDVRKVKRRMDRTTPGKVKTG